MTTFDEYRYWVPSWTIPLLVNGDSSGLTDKEFNAVACWMDELVERHGHALGSVASADSGDFMAYHEFAEFGADDCFEFVILVEL